MEKEKGECAYPASKRLYHLESLTLCLSRFTYNIDSKSPQKQINYVVENKTPDLHEVQTTIIESALNILATR